MYARPFIAKLILAAFILAALFGIYGMVSFAHAEHGSCPFSPGQHSACATPLEHLGHWQAVFTATFAEVLVLFALLVCFVVSTTVVPNAQRHTPWSYRQYKPPRPTLLQELFSQGILHRKEPQIA